MRSASAERAPSALATTSGSVGLATGGASSGSVGTIDVGTGAAVGATAAMAGGGATRGRRLLQPHSQQAALLVAQSTASQVTPNANP